MRAIMISVDYADLLAITLPWNRHHFEEVWVVTSSADHATVAVAGANDARVIVTDLFYAGGADFNKWAALEWGLDVVGRKGWLCLMDADVLWPRGVEAFEAMGGVGIVGGDGSERVLTLRTGDKSIHLRRGQLCTPLRRMWSEYPTLPNRRNPLALASGWRDENGVWFVDERCWQEFPVHRNVAEWAGYSQIFHADDPVLGTPPWHEVDWRHAGGADSFFQRKWPAERKVRPPFEVLHLGPAGVNWHGRATARLDGTVPEASLVRRMKTAEIWNERRRRRSVGLDPFGPERLGNEKTPPGR